MEILFLSLIRKAIIVIALLLIVVLAIFTYSILIYSSEIKIDIGIISIEMNENYYSGLITIVVSLFALALPLAVNAITANQDKRFSNNEMGESFYKNKEYIFMKRAIVPLIIVTVLSYFKGTNHMLDILVFIMIGYVLLRFVRFMKVVEGYVANFPNILILEEKEKFKRSLGDKVTVIRVSLEKILKAIVIKIESGDQISAANELQWFDDLLFAIYDLKTHNFKLFKELIDPSNRHVIIERPDLSKIDWSKAVYKESTSPRPSTQEARRSYNINVWQEEYDLLDSFISFSIKVWEASAHAEQFGVAKRALYAIGNIYGYVAFGKNTADKFNFISYYNFLNQVVIYRLDSLLSAKRYTEQNNSLIRFMMFQFHLDHFKDERFGHDKFDNFTKGILGSLKVAVDRGQPDFIKAFVRALAGMILRPLHNNPYAELQSAVRQRFEILHIEQNDLLKKILRLGFRKLYYLLTSHQQHTLTEELDKLESDLILMVTNDEISSLIREKITEIKSHALARHKYRVIQGALVKILIYSIFKKQYDLVDFALEYEEPVDADASWGNKDILPTDLRDIMLIMHNRSHIQHELMPYFPDRHGSPRYINILSIALLYRYSKYKFKEHVAFSLISGFLETNIDDWPEIHNTMIFAFNELKQLVNLLCERQEWPFEIKNEDRFIDFSNLIDQILRFILKDKESINLK